MPPVTCSEGLLLRPGLGVASLTDRVLCKLDVHATCSCPKDTLGPSWGALLFELGRKTSHAERVQTAGGWLATMSPAH